MKKRYVFIKKTLAVVCAAALTVAGIGMEPAGLVRISAKEKEMAAENCMDGIFENLTKADSLYSETKAKFKDYETGENIVNFTESCDGNKINITAEAADKNSESYEWYKESEGSWDFVLDGDYVTFTKPQEDLMGESMLSMVLYAVCDYLGLDKDLAYGLITAVSVEKITTNYYMRELDEETGQETFKIYAAGNWEIGSLLDGIYLDADTLTQNGLQSLGEESINCYFNIGKMGACINGDKNSVEIAVAEYGGRGDLTYKSLIDLVNTLKPNKYENFVKDYTKLQEVSANGYSVTFPTDPKKLPESFQDKVGNYQFTVVRFSESETGGTPTTTPTSSSSQKATTTPTDSAKPSKVKWKSVKAKKGKKIAAKWKKIAGVKGYQIQYSTNKNFKKAVKSKNTAKTSITLKAPKKKTYYIRVRAYKGTSKNYGKWSAVKKVKVKK